MNENKISELLIKLRKENGFTQSDLADKLDITFQAVSKWERGENLPDAYTLIELAKIYGITVDEILSGELKDKQPKKGISNRLKNIIMTVGILFLMISPIPYLARTADDANGSIIATLITASIGSVIFLFVLLETRNRKEITTKTKEEIRIEQIVYSTCVVLFLGTGLLWGLWYVGWLVFILGYVVTLIFNK